MTKRNNGFTLTEMLVVIGIILIIAIVAVPSFKALTGGRSTEAAQNQLSGILGRARSEAIGLQEPRGIAFFVDRESQRVSAIMVRKAPTPSGATVDYYLDAIEDRDPVLMPVGVGVQMVDNCTLTAGGLTPSQADDLRGDDAYVGFNRATRNGVTFDYGGAIMFDAYGRVVSRSYGFAFYIEGAEISPGVYQKDPSALSKALGMTINPGSQNLVPAGPPMSQFGFVVYDQEAFENLGFSAGDPQLDSGVGAYGSDNANWENASGEAKEERWIDANATPVLVNRNNGTLVKGM